DFMKKKEERRMAMGEDILRKLRDRRHRSAPVLGRSKLRLRSRYAILQASLHRYVAGPRTGALRSYPQIPQAMIQIIRTPPSRQLWAARLNPFGIEPCSPMRILVTLEFSPPRRSNTAWR